MVGDWRNMYLRPYRMQNVMNAYLAVMLIIPIILFVFSLVSFMQQAFIRDVSDAYHSFSIELNQNYKCKMQSR